jgi:hypothetical protein
MLYQIFLKSEKLITCLHDVSIKKEMFIWDFFYHKLRNHFLTVLLKFNIN